MAPSLVRPPFHRDGWVYEEKVDGWRMLAYKDGARVRLISRNAVDHTARFRELAAAIAKLRADVLVLDGGGVVAPSCIARLGDSLEARAEPVS
jgi:bifunctional non-homologous end joining protein LigD